MRCAKINTMGNREGARRNDGRYRPGIGRMKRRCRRRPGDRLHERPWRLPIRIVEIRTTASPAPQSMTQPAKRLGKRRNFTTSLPFARQRVLPYRQSDDSSDTQVVCAAKYRTLAMIDRGWPGRGRRTTVLVSAWINGWRMGYRVAHSAGPRLMARDLTGRTRRSRGPAGS